MNWLEELAKLKTISMYVGIGIASLIALALVVWFVVFTIKWEYKKHSKKYTWDCVKHIYVKKEEKK